MVGGTGGPRDPDNGGMRTETCSACDGDGEIWTEGIGERGPVLCRACGGTGHITYRTARQVVLDAEAARTQRDSTLELVKRQRAAAVARDVDSLPADAAAHVRAMRADYLSGAKWNSGEDR